MAQLGISQIKIQFRQHPTAKVWRDEYNTAGESVLMCDGNQIQSL